MSSLEFDTNDPQKWLLETRKLFQMWIYKDEIGGGFIKFDHQYNFRIPKTKAENEYENIPLQTRISYSMNDLNEIYLMISEAVRQYNRS